MQNKNVVIIGGGFAGSLAAAMLGRAGIDTALVDPHHEYPPDFRCEKLDGTQVAILQKTGLAEPILRAATWDRESWVARFGRVVDRRPGDQHGIFYTPLVNTVRGLIPGEVLRIAAKASEIATSDDLQRVTLSDGQEISARLVVLANGLNAGLRHKIGLTTEILSTCHSISIGFDVSPSRGQKFPFPALTYYADHPRDRAALITLFPIGTVMRANLFVYLDANDVWLKQFSASPREMLFELMPGLRKLMGDFEAGPIKIRPVDLYATRGYRRAGIVLIGDAFSTSCPAAGTGARKALTDVERLCNVHIPHWLATPGMDAEKIGAFYDDPVKRACDDFSLAKAYQLRTFSTDTGLPWRARRWAKFLAQSAVGGLRRLQARSRSSDFSTATRVEPSPK
ncbi:MAG TPA: NAD(P)/FAD-dependent oxidoreductase [Methylovirgula sp.]|nr:NAD(P)/FAD-dependent oxidoreductase [Methylovirgula sp.]